MYNKILVPIDGSAPAALGLAEAIALAKDQRAVVRLAHVVNELFITASIEIAWSIAASIEALRVAGAAMLTEGKSLAAAAGVTVESTLIVAMGGGAGVHLVKEAKDWAADLIVMGTHGRHGIARALMGSDAEYVVRHASVPVLLVRSHEADKA